MPDAALAAAYASLLAAAEAHGIDAAAQARETATLRRAPGGAVALPFPEPLGAIRLLVAPLRLPESAQAVIDAAVASVTAVVPHRAGRLTELGAALGTALAAAGAPPLAEPLATVGGIAVTLRAPPPPAPAPHPPGETQGSLLAASNAQRRADKRQLRDAEAAGRAVAYALAAVVVLWMPVHAVAHAITAAHARCTAVSVALALRAEAKAPRASRASLSSADGAAEQDVPDDGDEGALAGRRFGAAALSAVLVAVLAREASAASAADVQLPPHAVALRPLLRKALSAALGASSPRDGSLHATKSQRLAAREKPTGLAWRLKRWLASELHWQAREMRHALRALRRCCGGSRDPVGKVFRLVPPPPESGGDAAVLVEVTFSFGWAGRNGAACWRRRLRDARQLEALEAALAAELAAVPLEVTLLTFVCAGNDARPVTLALLDDEPHANLDKKLKAQRSTSVAETCIAETDADGRSVGIEPAVAERLEAVLALCALRRARLPRSSAGGALA